MSEGRADAPAEETLCKIVFGDSTVADAETLLGDTDRRETPESTMLLYQYTTGLTLSLLFREGVFVDATVYNGRYPDCWIEQERRHTDELIGQISPEFAVDGGL